MHLSFDFTIAANTLSTDPYQEKFSLGAGVITKVRFRIPPGPKGLARFRIYHGLHQAWPANAEGTYYGDDEAIEFREHLEIGAKEEEHMFEGYNVDTENEHTITAQFEILPIAIADPNRALSMVLKAIAEYLGIGG
jgi:hypothetical protein